MCLGCEGLDENDLKAAFKAINQWSQNKVISEYNPDQLSQKKKSICPPPPFFWKLKRNVLCFECNKYSKFLLGSQSNNMAKNDNDNGISHVSLKRTIDEVVENSNAYSMPEMDPHDYWDFI